MTGQSHLTVHFEHEVSQLAMNFTRGSTFFTLISPVVATALGAIFLREWFTVSQWLGVVMVLASTVIGIRIKHRSDFQVHPDLGRLRPRVSED